VPVYVRTCEVCLGHDPECVACEGKGESLRYRCPQSESGEVGHLVVRAAAQWQNGVLPAAGGWANQCAKLARLVDVASSERGKIEEGAAKQREKAPKAKGR
jgi:hypothetical protein